MDYSCLVYNMIYVYAGHERCCLVKLICLAGRDSHPADKAGYSLDIDSLIFKSIRLLESFAMQSVNSLKVTGSTHILIILFEKGAI